MFKPNRRKNEEKKIQEDIAKSLYLDLPIPTQTPKKEEDRREKTIPRGIWEIDI